MKKSSVFLAFAITAISSVAYGQGQSIKIEDGHIVLSGTYKQLAGIEAKAPDGLHIGEHPNFPGTGLKDVRPFGRTGTVVANTPQYAVIGVLGRANRIDIEGDTITGISYSGSKDDLTVNLGLGNDPPGCVSCFPEPSTDLMAAFGLLGLGALRRRRPVSNCCPQPF